MSWVKIDDSAPEHQKLLDAGAQAAWLWVCCLAYCNRQKRRDGLIPKTKIALLYPGLGLKHARRLVEVGLLHDADRCFAMHDYHEYQPSEDLSLARSMAGKQGGINSGASRRSKREANSKQELEPRPDPVPSRPDPEPPQSAVAVPTEPDPNTPIRCPVPVPLDATVFDGFELNLGMKRPIAEAFLRRWSLTQNAASTDLRHLHTWQKCAVTAVQSEWSKDKAGMRAAAEAPAATQSPEEAARMAKALEADNARREAAGRAALATFVGGKH